MTSGTDNALFKPLYTSIGGKELELFREYLRKHSGILVPPEKAYLFETRLSKMMADAGAESFGEFYNYIQSGADPSVAQKIINAMTVNETQWFRDAAPWKILEETVLPGLVDALAAGKKSRVRIWSAAVSTGQEAYSTVMCVNDYLEKRRVKGVSLSDFEFFATDISSRVLTAASKGRYDAISIMRGLSGYYRTKYFTEDGGAWNLDPKIRGAVKFARFNLQNSYLGLGTFDVIFCRYVLIYFSNELKKEIIAKMRGSLADGGVFFTGNYALYDLFEDEFDAKYYENCTYYTQKAVEE